MKDLKEILDLERPASDIINDLQVKSVIVPEWSKEVKNYEPQLHDIVTDTNMRKDKVVDGHLEKAARIYIGLEKLLCKRIDEFTFGIPVKRTYSNIEGNETRKAISKAIEAIYKNARIDAENINRGLKYYASSEIFTLWYLVKKDNSLYGFDSKYKVKCQTYSPMDGVRLYPLFDEYKDLLAMSFWYITRIGDEDVTFFETYTADRHYKWKSSKDSDGWELETNDEIILGKIPGIYMYRNRPVYDGLSVLRNEIEYTLSRNSDIIAYNAAPVLMVSGQLIGDEVKGETRRRYRVENGGSVSYVSWNQSIEAMKYQVENLIEMFFMQAQMPNISFEKMVGLGSIGYDARQTIFMDSHLKIADEAGPWLEFLDREANVIKAFLAKMNESWAKEVDNVSIASVITPFNQNDEKGVIDNMIRANGGKPLISQYESIEKAGLTENADETMKLLKEEASEEAQGLVDKLTDAFNEPTS